MFGCFDSVVIFWTTCWHTNLVWASIYIGHNFSSHGMLFVNLSKHSSTIKTEDYRGRFFGPLCREPDTLREIGLVWSYVERHCRFFHMRQISTLWSPVFLTSADQICYITTILNSTRFKSCAFYEDALSKLIAYCFVSMDNKNNDKQGNVSVNDVDVCNSRDILAKLVEKRCKPDWTFFNKLYAKGTASPQFWASHSRHL